MSELMLSNSQQQTKKNAQERKKSLLYLIHHYLHTNNLHETAESLEQEAQLSAEIELCDNVDLDIILQEYQSYYFVKFQKHPKITKKCEQQVKQKKVQQRFSAKKIQQNGKEKVPNKQDFHFEITSLGDTLPEQEAEYKSRCLLKPLDECDKPDFKEATEQIIKDVIPSNLGINFSNCIGLSEPINLIQEAVTYPLSHPQLFQGLITPWKGILLFGPPGTGKTLLAKALASENQVPLINVSSSVYISKWRGESEKMVRALFQVAKHNAPSVIFIDEIDALAAAHQHEASIRFKSELLVNLDGVLQGHEHVFVLAVTNHPWNLDGALLRRFEKRILVDVPDLKSRIELFRYYFSKNGYKFKNEQLHLFSERTDNYSSYEIKLICKETVMDMVREKFREAGNKEKLRQPGVNDVLKAIGKVNSCINAEVLEKYRNWHSRYGCT